MICTAWKIYNSASIFEVFKLTQQIFERKIPHKKLIKKSKIKLPGEQWEAATDHRAKFCIPAMTRAHFFRALSAYPHWFKLFLFTLLFNFILENYGVYMYFLD